MQSNSFFEYLCNEISWQRLLKVRANLRKKLDYQAMLMRTKRYKEHSSYFAGLHYRVLRDVERAMRCRNPLYFLRMYKRDIPKYQEAASHPLFRSWRNISTEAHWELLREYRRTYAASILQARAEGRILDYEYSIHTCYKNAAYNRALYNEYKAKNMHPARLAEIAGDIYLEYFTIEIISKAIKNSVHDRGRVLCCA